MSARLPAGFRVGTSTWSFPGWRGIVWNAPVDKARLVRDGLGPYAAHPLLRMVGVDRSWYAPVEAEEFARWAAAVPDDFRFMVKAPRLLSSARLEDGSANPVFLDPRWAVDHVLSPAREGLEDRLGVVVLQFSPARPGGLGNAAAFADRLHDFLRGLPSDVPVAVEPRNPELVGPEYAAALADAGAVHCYSVHPAMPGPLEQHRLLGEPGPGPFVARWMLRRNRRYEEAKTLYGPFDRVAEPDPDMRGEIATLAVAAARVGMPTMVSINNKAEGSAPLSAFALAEAVAARYSPVPTEASHSSSDSSVMPSNRNVER